MSRHTLKGRSETRTVEVLKGAGASDAQIIFWKDRLSKLRANYKALDFESPAANRKRKKQLADQFKLLAKRVTKDPDAAVLSLLEVASNGDTYELQFLHGIPNNRPTVAMLLTDIAAQIEETSSLSTTVDRKLSFQSFVIFRCLGAANQFVKSARGKNKFAAALASALLKKTITSNQVSQANKDGRRKYQS
jgi:hypothetical protein